MKKIFLGLALPILSLSTLVGCEKKPSQTILETDTYTMYRDVSYGNHIRHRYDICFPKENDKPNGLLLYIHGGGWVAGDKEGYQQEIVNTATTHHFVTAAMDYRYVNYKSIHCNEIMDDILNCVSHIKNLAKQNNLELNKMITTGGSAGGHLSLLYAYKMKVKSEITPVAVISYCGITDFTDPNFYNLENKDWQKKITSMLEKASGQKLQDGINDQEREKLLDISPINFVDENTVPTILAHGEKDNVVPFSNAVKLNEKLCNFGVKCDFINYPNSGHELGFDSDKAATTAQKAIEYYEYLN